jgi:hypothetical protein
MIMSNHNHFDRLELDDAYRQVKETEVRDYNVELRAVRVDWEVRGRRETNHSDEVEILAGDVEEVETGFSVDGKVKIEIKLPFAEEIVRRSHGIEMIFVQLRDSEEGFYLYNDNSTDTPGNVLGDGYCGYRVYDAVSKGLWRHDGRINEEDVRAMEANSRGESALRDRCTLVCDAIRRGVEILPRNAWLDRLNFADLICPVPLLLWIRSYDVQFNMLVGIGMQGSFMRTDRGKVITTRRQVRDHWENGGRDIVYADLHFYLGNGLVTLMKLDESLWNAAERLWSRRLEKVVNLEGICREVSIHRDELHYIFYPP